MSARSGSRRDRGRSPASLTAADMAKLLQDSVDKNIADAEEVVSTIVPSGRPGARRPGPAGSLARRTQRRPDRSGGRGTCRARLPGAARGADRSRTPPWSGGSRRCTACWRSCSHCGWPQRHPFVPFVLPGLTMYLIFGVFPTLQAFRYSLYDWTGIGEPTDFVGLDELRHRADLAGVLQRRLAQRRAVPGHLRAPEHHRARAGAHPAQQAALLRGVPRDPVLAGHHLAGRDRA